MCERDRWARISVALGSSDATRREAIAMVCVVLYIFFSLTAVVLRRILDRDCEWCVWCELPPVVPSSSTEYK